MDRIYTQGKVISKVIPKQEDLEEYYKIHHTYQGFRKYGKDKQQHTVR